MSLSTNEQLGILMQANLLEYSPSIDANLSNSRQLKKTQFSSQAYGSGGQPSIQINSGGDYVSGPTSYLLMTVTFPAAETKFNSAANGTGSAFNFIKEFQIAHKNGDVIDRTDNINALIAELVQYAYDSSYKEKFAQVFGYGNVADFTGQTVTFVLPLFLLSGVFAQKALIPSHLIAGARIQMQLETPAIALNKGAAYSDVKLNLVLDSIDLMDGVKKALMVQASNTRTQGLQYPYYSWFQTRTITTTLALNFDINFSAAKTMLLLIKPRINDRLAAGENSMLADPYVFATWRARIGSHTMPLHEVEASAESYAITMEAFDTTPDNDLMLSKKVQCGVGYLEYTNNAIVCVSLEKNTIVGLSGEVTNGARMLNFSATLLDGSPRTWDAYLKHLRVANCMIDNIVVDK